MCHLIHSWKLFGCKLLSGHLYSLSSVCDSLPLNNFYFYLGHFMFLFCFLSYKCYTTHQSIQTLFFSLFFFLSPHDDDTCIKEMGCRNTCHVVGSDFVRLWSTAMWVYTQYFLDICLACERARPASARYNYICSWLNRDGFGFGFGFEEEEEEESLKVMEWHMETKRSSSYKRLHITNQKDNKEKGDEKKKRKRRSWEKEKRERTAHAPMSYFLHLYLHYIFIIVLGLTQPS